MRKFTHGIQKIEWVKIRERNEALDNFVYALAGFYILSPNLNKIKTKSESQEAQPKQEKRKNLIFLLKVLKAQRNLNIICVGKKDSNYDNIKNYINQN